MSTDFLKVTIPTDYGADAKYEIGFYRAKAGMKLMRRLVQVASPVAGLFDTLISAVVKTDGIDQLSAEDEESQDKAIAALLKNVDASGVERVLRDFVSNLGKEGDADLLCEILSCVTLRSSEARNGNPERSNPSKHFDSVYVANYGEALRACFHCIDHNYGPALRTMLSGNGLSERVVGAFAHLAPQRTAGTPRE